MAIDGAGVAEKPKDRVAALLIIPLVLILGLVVGTFWVFYRAIQVDGPSMEPALVSGDRVLLRPGYAVPKRGDIVAFIGYPRAEDDLIKRVVGVPGDTVEVRDDVAYVNGERESYPFPVDTLEGGFTYSTPPVTVPEGSVYVMGDNRGLSLDSRAFGPVPISAAIGRATYVFFPLDRARAVDYGPDD